MAITESVADYLEAIMVLQREKGYEKEKRLVLGEQTREMAVTAASAPGRRAGSGMLRGVQSGTSS